MQALQGLIGTICHVYVDDIVVWSNSLEEHETNVRLVMDRLRKHKLYCNRKKSIMCATEIDFLGHHISRRGVEPDQSKIDKVRDWPRPRNASEVRSFLGLVRYISAFLPKLAQLTSELNPLTTKEAEKDFLWTERHTVAFEAIKRLVTSAEWLTTINHQDMGNNRIFVTCDASDKCTGAVLTYGTDPVSARPVAFESQQLSGAELNYPVHKKELLAIVRALRKWRTDLIGVLFEVLTDHRTLESFMTQRHLSRRQARWQEFLAQYDFHISYIKGAAALASRPAASPPISLQIAADPAWLTSVREGYTHDRWCVQIVNSLVLAAPRSDKQRDGLAALRRNELDGVTRLGVRVSDGLLYVGDRLVIPRHGPLREQLFRLAHDAMGHFGSEKSYTTLRNSYYWPNMRRDLEPLYVPSCEVCQRNKSLTRRPAGPLHPLPVPDARGDSIAMDFVGPLPDDDGYNCLLTITDRLGSDIRIVPTRTDLTAEELAEVFFREWYCNHGLPLEIISDRDKLFISRFLKALHRLTGVNVKMSSAYHPQTDGTSEPTNKTIVQALRFHVQRNQKG